MQKEKLEEFSEYQFYEAFKRIYKDIISNKYPVITSIATLLGGQPGAGKHQTLTPNNYWKQF